MSAVATRPRRLSASERTAMTPEQEQELERLTAEQEADDTHRVDCVSRHLSGAESLDVVGPDGGTLGSELIGRDPWDLIDSAIDLGLDATELAYAGDVDYFRVPRRGEVLTNPRDTDHGTTNAYVNRKCRCLLCSAAWAHYMRDYRAARKAA